MTNEIAHSSTTDKTASAHNYKLVIGDCADLQGG